MFNISIQPSTGVLQQKAFKTNLDSDLNYFQAIKYGDGIQPILSSFSMSRPLMYEKIAYRGDPKQIQKISVKGYRNISRVAASGEYTIDILKKIKQTSCIKLVRSVDFDPYFCDTSGLKPFSEVLKKLNRLLKSLTLIIRRSKTEEEVKRFSLFLARATNLEKIKIEILSSSGVTAEGLRHLVSGCRSFGSLRAFDIILGASKDSARNLWKVGKIIQSCYKLERVKTEVCYPHQNTSLVAPPSTKEKFRRRKRTHFSKNLKSMSIKFASKTGWAPYFDGVDLKQGLHMYFQNFPNFANPIHLSLKFEKMSVSLGLISALAEMFPRITNLKFVSLEIHNIKLMQYDFMVLAKGFIDCKQIEHLTFKYLDKAPIPVEEILQFITVLSKFSAFPKFDLFFRKLFYSEWQTLENKKKLDELENIKYVLTKQSIHIQKVLPIDI